MSESKKTDNASLAAKLAVRRYMLDRYHPDGQLDVMDCCQGSGVIWNRLLQEYDVLRYWGLDVKRRPGRLQVESSRVLAAGGWTANVVDVDTYGSPWRHWEALTSTLDHPATVFLTVGFVRIGGGHLSELAMNAMGLTPRMCKVAPPALLSRLSERSVLYSIAAHPEHVTIVEAVEGERSRNARYLGLRIEPKAKVTGGTP